jgi:hypothetical protein
MIAYRLAATAVSCPLRSQLTFSQMLTRIIALQFQLTITTDGESYEETEIIYNPLFNQQRDKELLDLLPDYLTEEICFPRNQAPKFYMKVVDSMSKKIVLEED